MRKNMVKRYNFKNCLVIYTVAAFITYSCSGKKQVEVSLNPVPLNQILDSYVENGVWPFLFSRIEHGVTGEVVYEHLSINNRLLPNTTIDGDTWMRIWSMSKLITISLAMDLMEDGIIHMQDPVHKYIPEFTDLMVSVDDDGKSIARSEYNKFDCPHDLVKMDSIMTIKHLFNHRAGFYYALTQSECINDDLSSMNILKARNGAELIELLSTLSLIQQPGESYYYGMNTSVLGLLLERVTKKSLSQLFVDRISNPYKIDGLSYNKPKGIILIPPFTGRDGELRKIIDGELDIFGGEVPMYKGANELFLGGEGMLGTAKGYIQFMRLLFFNDSNLFLEQKTIERMSVKPNDEENDYGYNTGFGSYLTSSTHAYERDILRVGGYEKTGCWVDRKNKIIGILFSQANETKDSDGLSNQMEKDFKIELYRQLNNK